MLNGIAIALCEKMADDIDEGLASHGSNYTYCLSSELKKLGRPYLVSGKIENRI